MTPEDRKSLLAYIKDVPEWQTALIHEQLAALVKSAAALSDTAGKLEQGFADGVLRPDRYYVSDRSFRKDCNTELFQLGGNQARPGTGRAGASVRSRRCIPAGTGRRRNEYPRGCL